jgi:hypothetical protein
MRKSLGSMKEGMAGPDCYARFNDGAKLPISPARTQAINGLKALHESCSTPYTLNRLTRFCSSPPS